MQLAVDCIDLGHEESASMLDQQIEDARAWVATDIDPDACVVMLDDPARDELLQMAQQMHDEPLPLLLRGPEQFASVALRDFLLRVRALLDEHPGIAVIDRLPMAGMDEQDAVAVFWVLGKLVGRPVAQKWDGTMTYDVADTGQSYSYGVRGSYTNVELLLHTDNAFAIMPPEYVALLCIRPALKGGVSRFCSIHTLHNRMLADHPRELERLYRCVLWDRQAEHAPGAAPIVQAPVFRYHEGKLSARLNVSLIKKGYQVAGIDMDSETSDAVAALSAVTDQPDLCFELAIERGQMQILNNRAVAHYRSEFTDGEDPARKRHLVRTWHRESGLPTYDG
ncbi:MAG: TauD/TfdA family dioxygenase [Gammaproteobacteria bacterium]|nr:TauD/TfdA family dioxygenase [Gammaproteobacteria bacterium]MDX2462609.1 TauD/TfdA family dioxygenase [Gammaproteobacteria bacterium]